MKKLTLLIVVLVLGIFLAGNVFAQSYIKPTLGLGFGNVDPKGASSESGPASWFGVDFIHYTGITLKFITPVIWNSDDTYAPGFYFGGGYTHVLNNYWTLGGNLLLLFDDFSDHGLKFGLDFSGTYWGLPIDNLGITVMAGVHLPKNRTVFMVGGGISMLF